MQDLSNLLADDPINVLVPTSQSGGNRAHDNSRSMTAPGGVPANAPPSIMGVPYEFDAPNIDVVAPVIKVGDDGMPDATAGALPRPVAAWKKTQ